jgi:hypothetical protein
MVEIADHLYIPAEKYKEFIIITIIIRMEEIPV